MIGRIKPLLDDVGMDPIRIAQEVAMLADRLDCTEECVRLDAHLDQFQSLMDGARTRRPQAELPAPEMNRRSNTISSKANDVEIAHAVIVMKEEIERLREQMQNDGVGSLAARRSAAEGSQSCAELRPSQAGRLPARGLGTVGRRQGHAGRVAHGAAQGLRVLGETRRLALAGKKNGRECWFLAEKDFRAKTKLGWFLRYAKVFREPVRHAESEKSKEDQEGQGRRARHRRANGASVRRKAPDAVSVFIAPPSFAELNAASWGQDRQRRAIARRLATSQIELPQYVHYDYLIVNDDLEGREGPAGRHSRHQAYRRIERLVTIFCRRGRLPSERLAQGCPPQRTQEHTS